MKTFIEFESMFVRRFTSAPEKIMIVDLTLDKRKWDELVNKYFDH